MIAQCATPLAEFAERFWARVDKSGECWVWTGGRFSDGYGQWWNPVAKTSQRAHRVAWKLEYGSIPPSLCVLHHCDNKLCVRPDHLFLVWPQTISKIVNGQLWKHIMELATC